jgi:hypothetical protein
LLDHCYQVLGQQERLIQSLTAELETLKRVIDDQDDADLWDQGDERRW